MRSALAEDTVPNLENPPASRPIAPTARPALGRIAPVPARTPGPRPQVSRPQPKPELERAMTTFTHGAVRPQLPPAQPSGRVERRDASGPQPIQARTSTPPALPTARPSAPPLPAARTCMPPVPSRTSAPPPRTSYVAPRPLGAKAHEAAPMRSEAPAKPIEATAKPIEPTAKPIEATAKPIEATAKPSEATAKPIEATAKPIEATAKPSAPPSRSPGTLAKALDRAAGPKPWYVTGERPRARTSSAPVAPVVAPLASHAPLVPSLDEVSPAVEARPSHVAPRPVRPLPVGGPPPTIIRDLDALFGRESRKPSAAPRVVAEPAQPPIDPARFAQMLLQKVESDFTPARASHVPAAPAPTAPAPAPSFAHAPHAPAPRVVAFVPSVVGPQTMERTAELALPEDDEDVAQLVPWYRRLWTKLFAR
jgi:hypothetical protein